MDLEGAQLSRIGRGAYGPWALIGVLASALVAGSLGASGSGESAADSRSPLALRLDAALQGETLASAEVAALVVGETGETLYARDPDGLRIPASNLKLLTALAVLDAFGPTHRFTTVIATDRNPDEAGAVGTLGIRGGGDPGLTSEQWWRLAADLRRRGLAKVDGDLIVDESYFDREYWHSEWGRISSRAFHAPVSGLSANYGAFFVRVGPGLSPGDPLRVQIDPPLDYLEAENRGRTVGAEAKGGLSVARGSASNLSETVVVSGQLSLEAEPKDFARSVRDPALYAGAVLKFQLEALGIEVTGRVRRGSADQPVELLRHAGRPVSELVRLFLKYSNNAMAEGLVKAMGASATGKPGSWPLGMAEVRRRLDALDVLGPGARLVDGSGLAPGSRLSPRMLVDAIQHGASSFRFGPEYVAALPIGARDGTLEKRTGVPEERVRAKTGLLGAQRVVSLSGFAERADGETVIFSILVNGYRGGVEEAMRAVDGWVQGLVEAP